MDRRAALKALGMLLVCAGGHPAFADDKEVKLKFKDPLARMNYYFDEEGILNLIIKRKDGSALTISFSEIVDALCEQEPTINWKPVKGSDMNGHGIGYPFLSSHPYELGARSDGVVVWRKK